LPFIEHEFPHLAKRYWATYAFDHRVSEGYREKLSALMRGLCDRHGVPYGYRGDDEDNEETPSVAPIVEQLALDLPY
jgi:hypothetical protein